MCIQKPEDHERMAKLGYTPEKPEVTESDYAKLSDKELDELLEIFKNVGRDPGARRILKNNIGFQLN